MTQPWKLWVKPAGDNGEGYTPAAGAVPEPPHTASDIADAFSQAMGMEAGDGTIALAGCEPTLAGMDAIGEIISQVRARGEQAGRVSFELHTGEARIDEVWARFLAKMGIVTVLRCNGPCARTEDALDALARSANALKAHRVPFAVHVRVDEPAARRIEDTYRFLRDNGIGCQQYTPCIGGAEGPRRNPDARLTPEWWTRYTMELFALWRRDYAAGRRVYVREFEALSGAIRAAAPQRQLFLRKESADQSAFVYNPQSVPPACKKCRWVRLCRECSEGEYHRMLATGKSEEGFCAAYAAFYEFALPRMMALLRGESARS